MNTLTPRTEISISSGTTASTGRRLLHAGMAAALAGIVSFASIGHAQENKPATAPTTTSTHAEHHHHKDRHYRHGRMDHAQRMEHRINRMLDSVNATTEQKAKVTAIAKAAFEDLRPLQEKSRANRAAQFQLLTQAKLDVDGLEKLRQEKLKLDDQRSHRVNEAFINAAVVLTPAQRMELAKHMKEHREEHQNRRMEHGHKKGGIDQQPQK